MLRLGNSGLDVNKLQQQLNIIGFGITENGQFDQETLGAVIAFQASRGLIVDGVVGPVTQSTLDQVSGNPVALMSTPVPINSLPIAQGVQSIMKISMVPVVKPQGSKGITVNQQVGSASFLSGFSMPMWGWVVMGVIGALAIKQLRRG